jgi:hypothetical protein
MLTAVTDRSPLSAAHHPGAESRPVCRQRRFDHWADEIYYEGPWEVGPLLDALTGHISKDADQCACTFTFEGRGLILQFWSHPWSGGAVVEVDGARRTVDLFGASPAMKNIHIDGLAAGMHLVRISGAKRQNDKHGGDQIVFHEAIVYDRLTEIVVTGAGHLPSTAKPARFNAIYYAPGPLGWAARAILYSTAFAARPANALIVGEGQGGAASIMVAALDDLGIGTLTCVDSDPDISPELWLKMGHRTALLTDCRNEAIAAARTRTGADFEYAFVDEAAVSDWAALVAVLGDNAIVLLHTASNHPINAHAELIDGGALAPTTDTAAGIRLMRRRRRV